MTKSLLLALSLMLSIPAQASRGLIHTETVISDTIAALPHCLHYKIPIHHCVWVSRWGEINTTPVLDHYLPDLVVSIFAQPHDNPWIEMNKTIDSIGQPIQKGIVESILGMDVGSGNHSLQDAHEQAVIFKEADVVGNPALMFIPAHGLLPSTAKSWQLYFQSMADSVLWRGIPPAALPEEGMALGLNIIHHVGTGFINWGGIFPHEGKVIGENDAQASMVIAQRAADLTTSHDVYGHITQSLATSCGKHCVASAIQENSKETYFQMIYPMTQTDCHILGASDSYSSDMLNPKGAYMWVVWRHYEGCADGDGQYMGRI